MNAIRRILATGTTVVLALTLASCSSNGTNMLPYSGPGPATQHLYVADNTPASHEISVYSLPLIASSSPAFDIATMATPIAVCFDPRGNMFVVDQLSRVEYFTAPLNRNGKPAASFAIGIEKSQAAATAESCATDAAGKLYVSDRRADRVYAYSPPFTNQSVPSFSMCSYLKSPVGIAFDPSGMMYVANKHDVVRFAPPFSSSSIGTKFGTEETNFGIAIDRQGDLFLANGSGDGDIDVYRAPINLGATASDYHMSIAGEVIYYLAFDQRGKMYSSTNYPGVAVFSPPFSGSSAPSAYMRYAGAFGISIGP